MTSHDSDVLIIGAGARRRFGAPSAARRVRYRSCRPGMQDRSSWTRSSNIVGDPAKITSRQRTHGRTSRGRSGRRRKEKSAILCSDRRSSMHVERRGLHPQLSLRTALLLASAVLMIIVGLLGMHTFSSNAVGHGTAVGAHSSSAVDQATPIAGHTDAVAASATSAEPTVCDDACMTGSTGGRSNMLSACILALFAGLLLLLRPLFAQRLSPPLMVLMSRLRPEVEDTLSRAPSLTFLSISRT